MKHAPLGQNFLKNLYYVDMMIKSLDLKPYDNLVEIGAGEGAITLKLIKLLGEEKLCKVVTYEIDKTLSNKFLNISAKGFTILNESFLNSKFESLFSSYKVIGSIPYYITSPIIHNLLGVQNKPTKICLMVQYEIAQKLLSKAPKSTYWSYVTYNYSVKKIAKVESKYFNPKPKVDSAIVLFEKNKMDDNFEFDKYSWFLHKIYKYPRKKLRNYVNREALEASHIDGNYRSQNLTFQNIKDLWQNGLSP